MQKKYEDCYISFDKDIFMIGNSAVRRIIALDGNIPISMEIRNNNCDSLWAGENRMAMFNVCDFDFAGAKVSFDAYIDNFGGESDAALVGELEYRTDKTCYKQVFYVFPQIPVISYCLYVKGEVFFKRMPLSEHNSAIETEMTGSEKKVVFPEPGIVDVFNMKERHVNIETVKLYDATDRRNELSVSKHEMLYTMFHTPFDGNIFILNKHTKPGALMLVREGYSGGQKLGEGINDFYINPVFSAELAGNGIEEGAYSEYVFCGSTAAVCCDKGNVEQIYRQAYRLIYSPGCLFIMSNTWGDRNRDKAISEEFVKSEIDTALELGVDIVQIDDGWQKGASANSGLKNGGAWGSFYNADNDFWEVNAYKFPNGFLPIAEYAKNNNIELGLWFSLDNTDNYTFWKRDAEKLYELYTKYGVRHFKIDGLMIENHACENNIVRFIKELEEKSNNSIKLNLDITANRRFGYFLHKQYASIFVENRYTDWQNYYPHSTLRNLWNLSRFIPPYKLQLEVLNNLRNDEKYAQDDLLRPSLYSIDYIFASVMVSNPLLWMEMSSLSNMQIDSLRYIISVYREHRDNMYVCDVVPIGDMPDGFLCTGFWLVGKNGSGYLIFLSEQSEICEYLYNVDIPAASKIEIIASNCENISVTKTLDGIRVNAMKKSTYIFCSYKSQEEI